MSENIVFIVQIQPLFEKEKRGSRIFASKQQNYTYFLFILIAYISKLIHDRKSQSGE